MSTPVLVIETGDATLASANSYVTVAEVNQFCAERGLTSWADLGNSDKITAILRGMDFVESEYDFKGGKLSEDDPLQWPRYGVYDDMGIDPSMDMLYYKEIPAGLKKAVCRAAYEESVSAGSLQANQVSNIRSESVDVISTTYFGSSPSRTIYRTIEGFLKGLLNDKNTANIRRT